AIGSAGAAFSYTSGSSSSGVLGVISGGMSASVDLSGHYTSASFHITHGSGGTVEIFDPPVVVPLSAIELPGTLGYRDNNIATAIDDAVTGKVALLGNYM